MEKPNEKKFKMRKADFKYGYRLCANDTVIELFVNGDKQHYKKSLRI
jgi:hypothetical protein